MGDIADLASEAADRFVEGALRKRSASLSNPFTGTERCVDCDDVIPEDRRQALPKADRCVDCQTILERASRR